MKQVAMNSVLDNDAETTPPFAMTELLRTYLRQSRSVSYAGVGASHREPTVANAQDLWDYLGDFA
jgi:hypothetical protein